MRFKLKSSFGLMGDQPQAVEKLVKGVEKKDPYQVLLGVTGSGKTFTIANVIEKTQRPTLVISHNKTLAAQLYQELRDFFPENAVSYFVSYYDYYQPEAYIPSTDTYIEKDAGINEVIDKLRLAATTNILTRNDVIVVASVSCIYNIGSPKEYGNFVLELAPGMQVMREQIIDRLASLQYERSDFGFHRGTFRVNGDIVDVFPAYEDFGVKIELNEKKVSKISTFDPVSGEKISEGMKFFVLYPSKHYVTDPKKNMDVFTKIAQDMLARCEELKKEGKELEAHRLKQKTTYDLEMIKEMGYVKGIENYSRYFDGRNPGDPPFSLLDYFKEAYGDDWLVVVDESHITFPQVRGMYAGDFSRKSTLIDYGFRLPASIDNRPLKFDEFMRRIPGFIAVSATPSEWEVSQANGHIIQQLVRPTGIIDPEVEIRPTETQVKDVIEEIKKNVEKKERTLVTTLTKRTAEDVSNYLVEQGIKAQYLHSDVKTLERTDILDNLRRGEYDCLIGVNLLREGLDLPEVSLVAILDADKEGFLRSEVSLVQTMGRAARHVKGRVILYADSITGSMKKALDEIKRRREYQREWNTKYNITPTSISKPIRDKLAELEEEAEGAMDPVLSNANIESLTPMDKKKLKLKLKREMKIAADEMNFELAAKIRDKIRELE
ncbi:MAG TPA: excinuclease ABC subunit UvrB [Candidatus Saccharimonadales bacterium]|nr:excinuclease ABC subunit UvrB [Candidatus Saccharimonadales bacterium]